MSHRLRRLTTTLTLTLVLTTTLLAQAAPKAPAPVSQVCEEWSQAAAALAEWRDAGFSVDEAMVRLERQMGPTRLPLNLHEDYRRLADIVYSARGFSPLQFQALTHNSCARWRAPGGGVAPGPR
jgi:hypothetical protein